MASNLSGFGVNVGGNVTAGLNNQTQIFIGGIVIFLVIVFSKRGK